MAARHNPKALEEILDALQRLIEEGLIKEEYHAISKSYLQVLQWVHKNTALIQNFKFDPLRETLYDALAAADKASDNLLKVDDLNKNLLSMIQVAYNA